MLGIVAVFALWQWVKMGFPLGPPAIIVSVWGMLKGAWYFMLTQSIWVVLWYILLILSIEIVTPPYLIDAEALMAIPLGMFVSDHWGVPLAWAIGGAFAAVFLLAACIIVAHFMFVRKFI